jgi:hypothetical protein
VIVLSAARERATNASDAAASGSAGWLAPHVEAALVRTAAGLVIAALTVIAKPTPTSAAPTPPRQAGCQMKGDLISGRGLGAPPPSFIRVTSKDGTLNEILPLPTAQSDMIETESLIPLRESDSKWTDVSCAAVNPVDAYRNVALSIGPCDYRNYTIVDYGPEAIFAGAARRNSTAVVRVQVIQEKYFASGIFTLDARVEFSLDGKSKVALPAKGVEPVNVTAYFPHLTPGHHHIAIKIFEGLDDDGAPQGTVCL